jgi:hypothetical protein
MADAVHGVILVGFGEEPLMRRGRPFSLGAWWRQHQQDVIDLERYALVAEFRDRYELTWEDAATVTALVWLGAYVGAEAVKAGCRRVRREIRAGRAARYYWTPADQRFLMRMKTDRKHADSLVKANAELTRVLARRSRRRAGHPGAGGHDEADALA